MIRVAFPGAPGAFSEDAVRLAFDDRAVAVPAEGFAAAMAALRAGSVDYCVLPVENSIAGPVTEALAVASAAPWAVAEREVKLRVRQCLLGITSAEIDSIAEVWSHPIVFKQCRSFLFEHPRMVPMHHSDTASAARTVASVGDATRASIGSARAAALYGLEVLEADIQDAADNETRFLVFTPRR